MTPRRLIALSILVTVLAALLWWHAAHRTDEKASQEAAADDDDVPVVSAAPVHAVSWQERVKAFGQVRAVQGADLSSEVAGIVDEIAFESGQQVKAGTVLVRLRGDDDAAKLAALRSSVDLWKANVDRDRQQFALQAVSRATLDQDLANLHGFQAQVDAQRALMEEKIIRAPFDGTVGIRQVDRGQYLVPGTPITSVQALDRLYIDFNLSQQQLGRLATGQSVQVQLAGAPDRKATATILAVDNRVDAASRMGAARALIEHPVQGWLPGMFVVVQVPVAKPGNVLAVPLSAVSYSPHGDYVYVLKPDGAAQGRSKATMRAVRLGTHEGDMVVVLDGLADGEQVVTAGQIKLRNGAVVRINNDVPTASHWQPEPADE
ncbi:efflux RND transporter periplasmic adaptor subunit [Dyella sp.]|uniref:efflux RND transporter periplasmic adaptor subunit n=1 Tax=Dyella sp. TaxID=1869338 RepID=UPI002ED1C072